MVDMPLFGGFTILENTMLEPPDPNGPCPCGSGKKFKSCCMKLAPLARKVIALEERDPEEALRLVSEAERKHPGNEFVLDMKFSVLMAMGRDDECMELVRKELQRNPSYVNGHCMVGDILFDRDDYRGALAAYETVRRLDPGYLQTASVLGKMACCCAKLGDHQQALDLATESIDTDSEIDEVEESALDALDLLLEDESAPSAIKAQALDMVYEYSEDDESGEDDDAIQPFIQSGLEAMDDDDADELLKAAQAILDVDPRHPAGLSFRARALIGQGHFAEGLDDLGDLIHDLLEEDDFIVDSDSALMLGEYVYVQGLAHVMAAVARRLGNDKHFNSLTEKQQLDHLESLMKREGPGMFTSYYTGTWVTEPFVPFENEIPLEAASSAKGKAFFRKTLQALENHMKTGAAPVNFSTRELRAKLHL